MGLTKALYRELVAAAKLLDSHASLRTLVSTDLRESPFAPDSRTRLPHVEAFNRCLVRYLGGRHFYLPDPRRPTLLQLVREEFRKSPTSVTDSDGLDTAFVALRAFNDTLAEAKDLELPPKTKLETWTLDGVQLAEYEQFYRSVSTKAVRELRLRLSVYCFAVDATGMRRRVCFCWPIRCWKGFSVGRWWS